MEWPQYTIAREVILLRTLSLNLQSMSRADIRVSDVYPLTAFIRVHAVLGGTSRLFGSQVLVFHFPGVVQGVKGGVPNQEPERPFRHLAGQLAL